MYFSQATDVSGFTFTWPDVTVTAENVHNRRRGIWRLLFTRDAITSTVEAQAASYDLIEPAFELGDPQTDGQANVPTEVSFTFNHKLKNITGLKAEITSTGYVTSRERVSIHDLLCLELGRPAAGRRGGCAQDLASPPIIQY